VDDQTSSIPAVDTPPSRTSQSGGVRILGKIDALDGFRGVAVLLVVVFHLDVAVPSLYNRVVPGGGLGVDAFFVLSGFLITAILLRDQAKSGRVRFGAFYRRRALRLLPALVFFLVVYMYYEWVTNMPGAHEPSSALSVIFYYSNTWLHRVPTSIGLGHLWSLAVEEQFYLVWPLCLALFFGLRRRLAPTVVLLVGTIAVVAIRRAIMWNHGVSWIWLYTRLTTRADALLVGCLIAQLWVRGKLPKRGMQVAGWIALGYYAYLIRVGVGNPFLYGRAGFTLIAISIGIVLVAILETEWLVNRLLRTAPLRAVGRVSYGLYIWHLAIFNAVLRYGRFWPPITQATVALSLAALATFLSFVLVERPFLRWKDRLETGGRDHDHDDKAPPGQPSKVRPARSTNFRHVAMPVPD
jgi:peptidoglycan/LPS O-acetylase OafA/YrhL